MGNDANHFKTLVVITPQDCQRLLPLYPRLVENIKYGPICFVGRQEVGDIVSGDPNIGAKAGFINEDSLIQFDDVHNCITNLLSDLLAGRELPRGVTGWYYQQFLKMQYALTCEDEYYMVWDGDTIPCRELVMFQEESGKPYLDLKHEHHPEYFETMAKILPGGYKVIERSFISEHMLIKTDIMRQLIETIERNDGFAGTKFWEKIINAIGADKILNSSFSEFETYGTFVAFRYPDVYKLRDWHSFRQGGTFFFIDTICDRDFEWLAKDFGAISFEKGHTVREDNANLFDNPYYQEKLTPRQMLQAAQLEYTEGYKEVWGYDDPAKNANISSGAYNNPDDAGAEVSAYKDPDDDITIEDRLKYLSEDTYKIYEELGKKLEMTNIDQAYLCYENAAFLCNDEAKKSELSGRKAELMATGKVKVNKFAFVIISFNNTYMIQRCIESIYTNCDPETYTLIILDNGSTDGTQEWLASWGEKHDEAYVILSEENYGFGGGNNAACQYLPDGEDVFFLNNDTRVPANAMFWLRMALYEADDIGAVGAIQNYFNNDRHEKINLPVIEQYMEHGAKVNVPSENPYEIQGKLCGFAFFAKREAHDKTTGFDDRFNPGYFEDDDLSLQIRSAGYKLVVVHNSFIYHAGSQSFRKRNDLKELFAAHREILVEKWGFDSSVFASISDNEMAFIDSLEDMGYTKDSRFSLVHVGSGCGNMLAHIRFLYPKAELAGVESNDAARAFAVPGIPIYEDINALPKAVEQYDIVAKDLG